jgi:hypothetical protein
VNDRRARSDWRFWRKIESGSMRADEAFASDAGRSSSRLIRSGLSFVLVVVLNAATGGCGGGSSAAGSSQALASRPSASRAQPLRLATIAKANAICRKLNVEFADHKPASQSVREIARLSPPRAVLERRTVEELSELAPPVAIARDWRQIIAFRTMLSEALAQLGHYANVNDLAAIRRLAVSKERLHQKLFTIASRDGLKDCSRTG